MDVAGRNPSYPSEDKHIGSNSLPEVRRGRGEDSIGQVYLATPLGIQVCEANGRVAQILNSPEQGAISGFAFGGKNLDWLHVTENGKIFRRPAKVKGVAAWAPVKPPKPPL